jgi:hypothetical protein
LQSLGSVTKRAILYRAPKKYRRTFWEEEKELPKTGAGTLVADLLSGNTFDEVRDQEVIKPNALRLDHRVGVANLVCDTHFVLYAPQKLNIFGVYHKTKCNFKTKCTAKVEKLLRCIANLIIYLLSFNFV